MKKIIHLSAALLLCGASDAGAQVQYTLTDLGTLGGTYSEAWGINNSGQVVGNSTDKSGVYHAFRTEANEPINSATDYLGTLGGTSSYAIGINESGQVAGVAYTSGGSSHAFRTEANQPINPATDDLGTLGGTYSVSSNASGINNSGQVVGNSANKLGFACHAFRTEADQAINPAADDLGTLGGTFSYANGINDSGQVVGYATLGSGVSHAFRTEANQPINPATDDLGTLGGTLSAAVGINNSGQVVGWANVPGNGATHAFRTEANQPINPATDDLGTLGGTSGDALAINNSGLVVGDSYTISGADHAFLYSGGMMYDLNNLISANSGWTLEVANGINDSGEICGYGLIGGNTHAFLLTPVPKPSTFALLAVGSTSLVAFAWRRRSGRPVPSENVSNLTA